jgi:hypothetical protein
VCPMRGAEFLEHGLHGYAFRRFIPTSQEKLFRIAVGIFSLYKEGKQE